MRMSDWSSDVCSSDLQKSGADGDQRAGGEATARGGKHKADDDLQRTDRRHLHVGDDAFHLVHHDHRRRVLERGVGDGIEDDAGGDELGQADARQHLAKVALADRSEEHTSELQSLMRISYAVFCLKKKKKIVTDTKEEQKHNQMKASTNCTHKRK